MAQNDMGKEFGRRIKLLRIEKEVTLTQAANDMDISQGALSDYERGAKLPGYIALQSIAHYYGVSYDYLFGETGAKNTANTNAVDDLGISEDTAMKLRFYRQLSYPSSSAADRDESRLTPSRVFDSLLQWLLMCSVPSELARVCGMMCAARKLGWQSLYMTDGMGITFKKTQAEPIKSIETSAAEQGLGISDQFEQVDFLIYTLKQRMNEAIDYTLAQYKTDFERYRQEAMRCSSEDISQYVELLKSMYESMGEEGDSDGND